jgi:hypothetical protein
MGSDLVRTILFGRCPLLAHGHPRQVRQMQAGRMPELANLGNGLDNSSSGVGGGSSGSGVGGYGFSVGGALHSMAENTDATSLDMEASVPAVPEEKRKEAAVWLQRECKHSPCSA